MTEQAPPLAVNQAAHRVGTLWTEERFTFHLTFLSVRAMRADLAPSGLSGGGWRYDTGVRWRRFGFTTVRGLCGLRGLRGWFGFLFLARALHLGFGWRCVYNAGDLEGVHYGFVYLCPVVRCDLKEDFAEAVRVGVPDAERDLWIFTVGLFVHCDTYCASFVARHNDTPVHGVGACGL